MARWKILKDHNLQVLFKELRRLSQALELEFGKIYLSLANSTLENLEKLKDQATRPDFFLRGKVSEFDALSASIPAPDISYLFITTPIDKEACNLAFTAPNRNRKGCLTVSGSWTALELARAIQPTSIRPGEPTFSMLFDSSIEVQPFFDAALADLRKSFARGRPLWAAIHDRFELISDLSCAGAIVSDSEMKGHLGFGPSGAPNTNIDLAKLPDLIDQLADVSAGASQLCWQIVKFGPQEYDDWNVLWIAKNHEKATPASLDLYSLESIPLDLRNAIENLLQP